MRRIDLLITDARRDSENVEFTETSGISDEQFLIWANRGQENIYSILQNEFPKVLQNVVEVNAVPSQEDYDIPRDVFLGTRLEFIEYSASGRSEDYYKLPIGSLTEKLNGFSSNPSFYIRRSRKILLQPRPQQSGKIRLTFQKVIPRLDKRRAKVLAVTLDTVNKTITSLTFDTTEFIDASYLNGEGYITIVDKDGNVQMRDIPVASVNDTTGVVTLEPGFVYEDGETIAVNNWVCGGKFSSTHSSLDDIMERYVTQYMTWKAMAKDSNSDSVEAKLELDLIKQDVLGSYGDPEANIIGIPIINSDYLFHSE